MPVTFYANFSPYHDHDPVSDFFDDDATRVTSIFALVIAIHIGLVFALSTNFIVPDLKVEEPDPIPVQIVAFEEIKPVEEAPPPEVELRPAVPAPAAAPKVKPKPQPRPEPKPVPPPPPPPEPEPEPEIEPDNTPPPPPPEILTQEVIEPEPEAIPEPEPIPEPVIPEPEPIEPEPEVEIFEPVPEPIIEEQLPDPITPEPVVPEPEPETEPEPIIEEPLPDPIEPEPEVEIEIFDPEPLPEPEEETLPLVTPEPVEEPPTPGPIIEDDLPELPPLEDLPPLPDPEPDPEVLTPPEPVQTIEPPEVEVVEPESPIVTTAPTVLASPEAPTSSEEAEKAVPQSQSDPFLDLLKKDRGSSPNNPGAGGLPRNPAIAGPTAGGGNIGTPPSSGTRRSAPGQSGWQLDPNSFGNSPGKGYEGLVLDIRCREAGKTHQECPEYLRTFQGRDRTGFESFNGLAGRGTDTGPGVGGTTRSLSNRPSIGLPIGDNSVNGGGPSTTIFDDGPEVDFSREFPNNPVRIEGDQQRVRDIFQAPEDESDKWELELLPPPEETP